MSSMLHVNENFAAYSLDKSPSNALFNPTDALGNVCDDASPYTIKRKSLNKQSANKFIFNNNSPYCLPSAALLSGTSSPKPLDDSFENLPHLGSNNNASEPSSSNRVARTNRYIQRRASNPFAKHKSAPLTGINLYHMYNTTNTNNANPTVLSDISNHINYKCSNSVNQPSFKSNDDSLSMDTHDDITDLENLVFGSASNGTSHSNAIDQTNYHHIVKQSLEFDAKFQNLIGDRSRQHILPVIQSNKHQDLHCISPETVSAFKYIIYLIIKIWNWMPLYKARRRFERKVQWSNYRVRGDRLALSVRVRRWTHSHCVEYLHQRETVRRDVYQTAQLPRAKQISYVVIIDQFEPIGTASDCSFGHKRLLNPIGPFDDDNVLRQLE